MEEKNTTVDSTEKKPEVDLVDKEPIAEAMEATPARTTGPTKNARMVKLTVISVLVVVVALAGVWYVLEKDGRIGTSLFSGIIDAQESQTGVAVVNGEVITASELAVAQSQLTQAAAAQGADPADPTVQASIQRQALDLIIGSRLLTQTAEAQGMTVGEEELAERLAAIEADAGGAEVLAARLQEFGITMETLEADIQSELLISKLLETVTADAAIEVTEEEVVSTYEEVANTGAELPPLDEVRGQIEAQLQQTKEQTIIEDYVAQLRADADIEIIE